MSRSTRRIKPCGKNAPTHQGLLSNASIQQWTAVQATHAADLTAFDVWMYYVSIGGQQDGFEVTSYLAGLTDLPPLERDLIAHAINELIAEKDQVDAAHHRTHLITEGSGFADDLRDLFPTPDADRLDASVPTETDDVAVDAIIGEPGWALLDDAEYRRCNALFESGLLDSGAKERFDRITAQARKQFGVSSASIALITEDPQVIKSVAGPIGADLPREVALCSRTIEADQTLVIANTRTHSDFRDHPLVVGGPRVQFYAGRPVTSADGWRIGTLCLIDDRPRSFSDEDARELRLLAAQVQNEIWRGRKGSSCVQSQSVPMGWKSLPKGASIILDSANQPDESQTRPRPMIPRGLRRSTPRRRN